MGKPSPALVATAVWMATLHHAMNGTPILPGVMGIEGFSDAARHISSVLGSARGSFQVSRLEDIRFLAPFKFFRNEPRRITWKAQAYHTGSGLVVQVSLESNLATKVRRAEHVLHFDGKVYLAPSSESLEKSIIKPPHWNGKYTVEAEQIYACFPASFLYRRFQRTRWRNRQTSIESPFFSETPEFLPTHTYRIILQTAGIWRSANRVLALPDLSILKLIEVPPMPATFPVQPGGAKTGMCFGCPRLLTQGVMSIWIEDYRTSRFLSIESGLLQPW